MSNLLSVVRISDLTDATTSPERQRAKNQQYADLGDHKIIATAEDLDVSGKISPFERKSLGPWLNDPVKVGQWDAIIVSKLDRLSRSVRDFCELVEWLTEHGKKLVCLDPSIDLTSPWGEFMAQMIVGLAQFERKITSVRVKESTKHQRAQGQYVGGQVPFGYMPVKLDGKGWGFGHDPVCAPVVQEMARKLLAGESQHMIAEWLNDHDIPTSRNVVRRRAGKPELPSTWKATSVRKVLGSPAIAGVMTSNGDVLRDADGMPVRRAEPIIDDETFALIQEKLQQNSHRTGPRSNGAPLLRVAFCGSCGSVCHLSLAGPYKYYHCVSAKMGNGCTERRFGAADVEAKLKAMVLAEVGDRKMTRKVVHPAFDNTAEIAQIEDAIDNLTTTYASAGMSAERYAKAVATLEARQAALGATETHPERIEWVAAGTETVREHYESVQDLNAWLRDRGVTIHVRRNPDGSVHGQVNLAELDVLATA